MKIRIKIIDLYLSSKKKMDIIRVIKINTELGILDCRQILDNYLSKGLYFEFDVIDINKFLKEMCDVCLFKYKSEIEINRNINFIKLGLMNKNDIINYTKDWFSDDEKNYLLSKLIELSSDDVLSEVFSSIP